MSVLFKKESKSELFSKYLIVILTNKKVCLIHLGMSGTIHFVSNNKKKDISNLSFYHSPRLPKKHITKICSTGASPKLPFLHVGSAPQRDTNHNGFKGEVADANACH